DQKTKTPLLSGTSSDGLYHLPVRLRKPSSLMAYVVVKPSSSCRHLHLGHPHQNAFDQAIQPDGGGELRPVSTIYANL
ncbi:hypothetical protein HAX54_002934, partial [Datura stramonium]|nr:hypothetical protein [Datura stramonium]